MARSLLTGRYQRESVPRGYVRRYKAAKPHAWSYVEGLGGSRNVEPLAIPGRPQVMARTKVEAVEAFRAAGVL